MSRLTACFEKLRKTGKKALVPFVTAGDPVVSATVPLMHALVKSGADIIELGVPFSDPMADGPVIQLASERALVHGVRLVDVIEMVREFRTTNATTPVVLMGYLNPVEVLGYERVAELAAEVGVDGFILVDLPPEEAEIALEHFRPRGIDMVFLIAPTTTAARIKKIAAVASGYLYYVSLKGVTGAATLDVDSVQAKLETIRNITSLPVTVGFGIKDAASAVAVGKLAEGVVVGSALVSKVAELQNSPERITTEVPLLLAEMRSALDALNQ